MGITLSPIEDILESQDFIKLPGPKRLHKFGHVLRRFILV